MKDIKELSAYFAKEELGPITDKEKEIIELILSKGRAEKTLFGEPYHSYRFVKKNMTKIILPGSEDEFITEINIYNERLGIETYKISKYWEELEDNVKEELYFKVIEYFNTLPKSA